MEGVGISRRVGDLGSILYESATPPVESQPRLSLETLSVERTSMSLNWVKLFSVDLTVKGLHLWIRGQLRKYPLAGKKKATFFKRKTKPKIPFTLGGMHLFRY